MTLAPNLQRLMSERDLGVRELANLCGRSASRISDYQQGVMPTDFRLVRKIRARELAKRVGSSPANISDYRQGVVPQDFRLVRRIADALGVTMSILLTGEDDVRPSGSEPRVTEVFDDGGPLYEGYARITIQRLIPRGKKPVGGGDE